MVYAIFALSLKLLVGTTGLVCFGQAAFFGLAGYAAVLLSPPSGVPSLWWLLPAAMGTAALYAGGRPASTSLHHTIELIRKGRKPGYVIAPASLLDETDGYVSGLRFSWLKRARRKRRPADHTALFINARGSPAGRNAYQRAVSQAGLACGFKATTHLLRATFACMLLARLEHLASEGARINPLVVVKVLLGHEHVETTDRYLRAIAIDACVLKDVLDTLLSSTPEL
jgi:hypothetical protein